MRTGSSAVADAKARNAAAAEMMAAQSQPGRRAARAAAPSGADVTAVVVGMCQVGLMNFDALMEFEVTVLPDEMPPYPARAHQTITQAQLAQMGPGQNLRAKADTNNPAVIWLDLTRIDTVH